LKRASLSAAAVGLLYLAQGGCLHAEQTLIPVPYPESSGINSMDQPIPQQHYHQHLIPDAAPAAKGPNALGNPHHLRRHYHQYPVPEPYPRQWWSR
jgi:hypothetical protein